MTSRTCPVCGKPLTSADNVDPQGPQTVKVNDQDRQAHADCFFDMLGDELEKHPVRKPGSSRG